MEDAIMTESKAGKPGAGKGLSAADMALMTAFLIHEYAATKGKPVTRFRIPAAVLWPGPMPEARRSQLVAAWKAALLADWGWIAFENGKHFALIQAPLVKGWVMLGGKRFMETRQKMRGQGAAALDTMRQSLADAANAAAPVQAAA
jgi:hypothetical protein